MLLLLLIIRIFIWKKYKLTLLDPQRGIKIGNAAADCETTATAAYGWQSD